MTNAELSCGFNKVYPGLRIYTQKAVYKLRRNTDIEAVLSECYLYLHKNIDLLENQSQLEQWAKKWISSNLTWSNSPFNRSLKSLSEVDYEAVASINGIQLQSSEWIYEQLEAFEYQLSSYDKRLFNIYFKLENTTGKLISKHLSVSLSTAYIVLRECKQLEIKLKSFLTSKII